MHCSGDADRRLEGVDEVDGDEHSRRRHAEREGREETNRQARPLAHQCCLQQAHYLADVGMAGRVVAHLPVPPVRRRLVVRLSHLRLVDSLAQYDHVLVDEAAAAAVPAEGGDLPVTWGAGTGAAIGGEAAREVAVNREREGGGTIHLGGSRKGNGI